MAQKPGAYGTRLTKHWVLALALIQNPVASFRLTMLDVTHQSTHTGDEGLPHPRVVLCGTPRAVETEFAQREISALVAPSDWVQVSTLEELAEWMQGRESPELFVFVQTWPDEFRFEDLLSIPGIGHLSRLIVCYGPWCISDGRSRPDFPLAVRVPIEHLSSTLRQEFEKITATTSPLPWTAGRDEIFRDRWPFPTHSESPGDSNKPRTVALCSSDRELRALWRDLFQATGYRVVEAADAIMSDVVIHDADLWNSAVVLHWREWRKAATGLRIIAMTGLAHPQVIAEMLACGATRVLSKLLPLEDLVREVDSLPSDSGLRVREKSGGHSCPP